MPRHAAPGGVILGIAFGGFGIGKIGDNIVAVCTDTVGKLIKLDVVGGGGIVVGVAHGIDGDNADTDEH